MQLKSILFLMGLISLGSTHQVDETDILRNLVYDWRQAWEDKTVETYMSFYSLDFRTESMNHIAWRAKKVGIFQNREISVDISEPEITIQDNRATAKFKQLYRSDLHSDYGEKTLVLIRSDGPWKIISEEWKSLPIDAKDLTLLKEPENPVPPVKGSVFRSEEIQTEKAEPSLPQLPKLGVDSVPVSLEPPPESPGQEQLSQDELIDRMFKIAKWGKAEELAALLDQGTSLAERDSEGKTMLHWASFWGNLEVVNLLIERGADVNALERTMASPLHAASMGSGDVGVVRALISAGALVNASTKYGRTPLHSARQAVAEVLLAEGADVNARDGFERTPLHVAAYMDRKSVAELLLAHGAEVHSRDRSDMTPQEIAAKLEFVELATFLEIFEKHEKKNAIKKKKKN
ncbi:ankyrin repeat domain-containing protein [Acidobacteriota bacterium]